VGMEIERKFLVQDRQVVSGHQPVHMRQGYLSTDPESVVRVRITDTHAWLTVKSRISDTVRHEFEWAIPVEDADQILNTICMRPIIEKKRYRIGHGNHLWEVDVFMGENTGLVIAEIELSDEQEPVEIPEWVGDEVSNDPRYLNINLVRHPYSNW